MDRQKAGDARTGFGKGFENQCGIQPAKARPAMGFRYINRGQTQLGCLAQYLFWHLLGLIPFNRMGGDHLRGKIIGHIKDGLLFFR